MFARFAVLAVLALIPLSQASAMGRKPPPPEPLPLPTSAVRSTDPNDYRSWFDRGAYDGHRIKLFNSGQEFYDDRMAALDQARSTVYVATFIWEDDHTGRSFAYKLCHLARRGLEVRILLDWKGARIPTDSYANALRNCGAFIIYFNPPAWDLAGLPKVLHEKLLIIDGEIVYTGGSNFGDNYTDWSATSKIWYDRDARVDGPIACWYHRRFVESYRQSVSAILSMNMDPFTGETRSQEWTEHFYGRRNLRGCTPVSKGTARAMPLHYNPVFWPDRPIKETYKKAFRSAHELVRIYSPYFVPGKEMVDAMLAARARGVRIQVLSNSRRSVDEQPMVAAGVYFAARSLIDAGVEVRLWNGPSMMHRKGQIFDGKVASLGTDNFDRHSLEHASENMVFTDDENTVAELTTGFDADFATAHPLTRETVRTEVIAQFSGFERWLANLLLDYL